MISECVWSATQALRSCDKLILFLFLQALNNKLILECIKTSRHGDNLFLTPLPWTILPIMLVFLTLQLQNMDRGCGRPQLTAPRAP